MLKLCFVALLSLLATGCFLDKEDDSEAPSAEVTTQSWRHLFADKSVSSEEDTEQGKSEAPYVPPFGIQPLPKANLFGDQPLTPEVEDHAWQRNDRELTQQLQQIAHTDAVNRFNFAAWEFKAALQRLDSGSDAGAVAQLRGQFDALKRANLALGYIDHAASIANNRELNLIEPALSKLEAVHQEAALIRP